MSNRFGYPSNEPCTVCGLHKNNQQEPRFGYVVCETHQSVPPIRLEEKRKLYQALREGYRNELDKIDEAGGSYQ